MISLVATVVAIALSGAAHAAGDPNRGARAFGQCMACHSVQPGEHMTGPSLAHVFDRKAGTVEGFQRFSEAIKRSGIVWNAAALDKWLSGPEVIIPGNSMTFAGIKDSQTRQDLIAYLQAVDKGKAPPMAKGGGGMMGMARAKADLKKAPPAGQVRSIKYCGDTYAVETADGKTERIWEFNLRFKTDSSKLGPPSGKPVVLGAGMQGDRASIVFASPKEISEAIRQSCP